MHEIKKSKYFKLYVGLLFFYIFTIFFGVKILNKLQFSKFVIKIIFITIIIITTFIMKVISNEFSKYSDNKNDKLDDFHFIIFISDIIMTCQIAFDFGVIMGILDKNNKYKIITDFLNQPGKDILSIVLMIFIIKSLIDNILLNNYLYIGICLLSFCIAGVIGIEIWTIVSLVLVFLSKFIDYEGFYRLYLIYKKASDNEVKEIEKKENIIRAKIKKIDLIYSFFIIILYLFLKVTENINITCHIYKFIIKDYNIVLPNIFNIKFKDILNIIFKGIDRVIIMLILLEIFKKTRKVISNYFKKIVIYVGNIIDNVNL